MSATHPDEEAKPWRRVKFRYPGFPTIWRFASLHCKRWVLSQTARVNPAPIFVLGHSKSGTSAIAGLLGEATRLSATIDIRGIHSPPIQPYLLRGEIPFDSFIKRNRMEFSRDIIKDPNLTLLYKYIHEFFPSSNSIFVVRDPRDTIRSVLDRLSILGNLQALSDEQINRLSPAWQLIFDGRWLGLEDGSYIETLAQRWNLFSDVYLLNRSEMRLVRYEDFISDKAGTIHRLAEALGLEIRRDISDKVGRQYQRRGRNRETSWEDFFGLDNLRKIESTCVGYMEQFGYKPVNLTASDIDLADGRP